MAGFGASGSFAALRMTASLQQRCSMRDAELLRFGGDFFDGGEEEGEDRAVVDGVLVAAEGEVALMAGDDAGRDPKAEASAVEIFGGVKGLEEAGLDRGRHAVAGVGDGDADAGTAVGILGGIDGGVVSADEE